MTAPLPTKGTPLHKWFTKGGDSDTAQEQSSASTVEAEAATDESSEVVAEE